MGEEVDAALVKKVKQTQELLGTFIRRPPLTEKHLMKPPFRFIHDIVMSVVENTGFLYGLYDGSELDATTITTRETKTAWMQKFVDCLKLATGQEADVKISKILAGQEPSKTNDLLILLGQALSKNTNSDKAVQAITGKDLSQLNPAKSKGGGEAGKEKSKKEPTKAKETASPYSQSVQKKPGKAPSRAKNTDEDKSKRSKPSDATKGRQSKAGGAAGSPTKGVTPKPGPPIRQASSDRLASSKSVKGSAVERAPLSRGSSVVGKQTSRLSNAGSTEDGLGEGDGIQEEMPGKGIASRRESLTSAATVRAASNYGQASLASGPTSGGGDENPSGTFPNSEAHADDEEQAEFMGELEFLLKKHGYEGDVGHVESEEVEGEEETHANEGAEVFQEGKEHDNVNTDIPGSREKDSVTRKNSLDNTLPDGANKEEHESLSNEYINETVDSPSIPPSEKSSAAPYKRSSSSRAKTGGLTRTQSPTSPFASPHPSTSALSLTNAALGSVSPSPSLSAKSSIMLPDINEKIQRPPTARPHTSQMRPGGTVTAVNIPRPPSARPGPPRPKTALFVDKEESNFRPTTAKVTTVLLDNNEDADDDNYIVHVPEKAPGALQLEEGANLGVVEGSESMGQIMDSGQHGKLVEQMLDAQSKLEGGSRIAPGGNKKTDIERDAVLGDQDKQRWREVTTVEVEKLKSLMQLMARNANPLGKLMDFVQEDVDAMQRDLGKWREESRKLDSSLEAAQEATENSLEHLRRRMAELDESIQEKQDAIAATKMTIFRQEERIRKVLSGLDRVKPRMANEPIITSADLKNLIEPDGNYDFGGGGKVYFKRPVTSASP